MEYNEQNPEQEESRDGPGEFPVAAEAEPAMPPQEQAKKKLSPFAENLLSWVKVIVVAFILAMLIKTFLVVNATVMSGSMESTIMTGDRIMCNRLAYVFGEPQRYDIIAFDFVEPDGVKRVYVKRVIGLPGETVTIEDGLVYVDGSGEPLRSDFLNDPPRGDYGPYEIPEGHYLVLGDNRDYSADSRRWADPYLDGGDILGKAMFRYYPNITWMGDK